MPIFTNLNWKSVAALVLGAFVSANSVYHWVTPDIQAMILTFAGGFGLLGVHHALDDGTTPTVPTTPVPVKS